MLYLPQSTGFLSIEVRMQRVARVLGSHPLLEWYASTFTLGSWSLPQWYNSRKTYILTAHSKFLLIKAMQRAFLTAVRLVHFIDNQFIKVFFQVCKEERENLVGKHVSDYLIKLISLAAELMQWTASCEKCLKLFMIQPNCRIPLPLSK